MRRNLKGRRLAAGCCLLAGLTLPAAHAATIDVTADITVSETWTADNEYVLTQVIYVTNGATLTIEPGTVVRGEPESSAGALDPGTLVVTRGSKLRALGTADRPIVFTDLVDDNVRGNGGTFPYDTGLNALSVTGQWGGVILLGRGYVSNNTLSGPSATREVQIEGLTAAGSLGFYGNGGNDDDDSGSLSYVSIRFGGFNLSANNEINGLTLGAVGRQTDIDHLEVFQNKDDGVEMFGGAVNLKRVVMANGGDDGLDYDEGWRGKAQFVFVMQGTPGTDKSDKGAEQDGGNSPDGSLPLAIPTIHNATYIGLGGTKAYSGRLTNTGLVFRDNAGGRYYNSFFGDFGGATLIIEGTSGSATGANSSGERATTAYTIDGVFHQGPASDFQLELQDNEFWCFGNGGVVPSGDATAYGGVSGLLHYDNGAFTNASLDNTYHACANPLPIGLLSRATAGATAPDPILAIDPRPAAGSPLLATDRVAPADGFFEQVSYKGAFGPVNWARGWTGMSSLGVIAVCDPSSGQTAAPDEVVDLDLPDATRITFTRAGTGFGSTGVYDVIRSGIASDFVTAATCVESGDVDTVAVDTEVPAGGGIHYFLVRATNACGDGSLGFASNGASRAGRGCP